MMNFGAFVAVNPTSPSAFLEEGAVEGLLHRSQMAVPRVDTWKDSPRKCFVLQNECIL